MNKVILIGRLPTDPEEKAAATDTQMARYTLAVDKIKQARKNQEISEEEQFLVIYLL